MRYAIVLLSLAFAACGSKDVVPGPTHSPKTHPVSGDSDLKPYLNRYYLDASRFESRHVYADIVKTMKFVDGFDQQNVVGRCSILLREGKPVPQSGEIFIRRDSWGSFSEASRMGLMYHELTHCAQGRDHDPENSRTIMAPSMLDESNYTYHWYELIQQLFTKPSAPGMHLSIDNNSGKVTRIVFDMTMQDGKFTETRLMR